MLSLHEQTRTATQPDVLTPREWEVLEFLREGLSKPEIAERLGIGFSGSRNSLSGLSVRRLARPATARTRSSTLGPAAIS